jgi:hypothetical protein
MIIIQKNIPIPKIEKGHKKRNSYPFQYMNVGDSFILDRFHYDNLRVASIQFSKRHNVKFQILSLENFVRIWRVK